MIISESPATHILDYMMYTCTTENLNSTVTTDVIINNEQIQSNLKNVKMITYVYIVIRSLWALMAILGNLLTILAVFRFTKLYTETNLVVISLAICDLISGLFLWPIALSELLTQFNAAWTTVCHIQNFFIALTAFGNTWNIGAISVERFIFLYFPLRYHNFVTMFRVKCSLMILWGMGICFALSILLGGNELNAGDLCGLKSQTRTDIYMFYVLPMYAFPSCITLVLYSKIAHLSWKRNKEMLNHVAAHINNEQISGIGQETHTHHFSKHQLKITKMLGLVLGIYFILYIPPIATRTTGKQLTTVSEALSYYITLCIYYCNSWVNSYIYGLTSKDFREAFRKMLGIS